MDEDEDEVADNDLIFWANYLLATNGGTREVLTLATRQPAGISLRVPDKRAYHGAIIISDATRRNWIKSLKPPSIET